MEYLLTFLLYKKVIFMSCFDLKNHKNKIFSRLINVFINKKENRKIFYKIPLKKQRLIPINNLQRFTINVF
jgi:hypothetical protein